MKNILLIIVAVVVALVIQNVIWPHHEIAKTESAYERVMRTGTLHCAYAVYSPFLGKDANSGQLNGIVPAVMGELEKANGIKIEWGPEIDWGNIAATLEAGKADAFCAGMLLTPKRGKVIAGSLPLYYVAMEAYARSDDKRFDNNQARIDQPDVRLSVNAGDISEELAERFFPQAQRVYKGAMGGEDELFMNVAAKKADVTFSGPSNLSTYNRNNPATAVRKIEFPHPLMVFQAVIGVDIRELALQQLLNAGLQDLINAGAVDRILRLNLGSDYGIAYFPPKRQID